VAHRTAEAKKNARANETKLFDARFIVLRLAPFYLEVNARLNHGFGETLQLQRFITSLPHAHILIRPTSGIAQLILLLD
jgi:hypothetical protein